jgi:NAD(P)-dependent dehydrogenase (short-subunit alcohol dehydrogenase family)
MGYRHALVTGASSGIGRALALELAAGGASVVLVARREPLLSALAEDIERAGGRALVEVLDVSDADATARAIAAVDERVGGLDLVVACAGVGPALDEPSWSWRAIAAPLHVNLCGAAASLTGALPGMLERGRGHLVGVSSLASFGALPESAAYCTPKAGLSMLLACLRLDLEDKGIAVTAVHAGFVDTPMVAHRRSAMPQLLTAAEAARHIARALPARPARIDFPQPLAWAARLGARLPRPLHDALLRRLAR